jgi:hypothetical protein
VPLEVLNRRLESLAFFLQHADCGIARIAEQTADHSRRVIVIDAEMMQERSRRCSALHRSIG